MSDLPPYDQLLVPSRAAVAEVRAVEPRALPPPNLRLRNTAIIAGGAALIGAYAVRHWWNEGFTGRFQTQREGDFGLHTQFAGVDKLGHVYSNYFAVRVLSPFFEAVGNPPQDARKLAALSAWGIMAAMEIGDGYSKQYRFSPEDLVANTAGALLGYALESNPEWDRLVDFRLSYRKTYLSNWDPFGDYGGQRFHFVVKAEGVAALRDLPVARYLEVSVGYGAPGIDVPDEWRLYDFAQRRRELFFGVGINLSKVMADVFYGGRRSTSFTQRIAEHAFDLFQFQSAVFVRKGLDVQGESFATAR